MKSEPGTTKDNDEDDNEIIEEEAEYDGEINKFTNYPKIDES